MSRELLGIAAALALWLPLVTIVRYGVVRAVRRRELRPRLAAAAFSATLALVPWLLMITGAFPFDALFGAFVAGVGGVSSYVVGVKVFEDIAR